MNRYGILAGIFVACLAGGLIWSANHYYGKYRSAQKLVDEQKKTLTQQAGLITTLRADDARNRTMMAEQRRREQQLRQQGEIYQRKLRDALKGDKCGNSPMPAAVVELLQQKTVAGTRADDTPAP